MVPLCSADPRSDQGPMSGQVQILLSLIGSLKSVKSLGSEVCVSTSLGLEWTRNCALSAVDDVVYYHHCGRK